MMLLDTKATIVSIQWIAALFVVLGAIWWSFKPRAIRMWHRFVIIGLLVMLLPYLLPEPTRYQEVPGFTEQRKSQVVAVPYDSTGRPPQGWLDLGQKITDFIDRVQLVVDRDIEPVTKGAREVLDKSKKQGFFKVETKILLPNE